MTCVDKIYKELDKVVLSLTKKLSGEDNKKGFKMLQAQARPKQ